MKNSTRVLDGRQARGLTDLAAQINEHHRQCEKAMNQGLRHALEAGRLLLAAKAQVKHGDWGPWLKENFDGSDRTARAYMQLATRWPEIEAKRQRAADLSYRDAVKLLAEPQLADASELAQAESAIADYARVGEALRKIRDLHLYRGTHRTFYMYCRDRWDLDKPDVKQLIAMFEAQQRFAEAAV